MDEDTNLEELSPFKKLMTNTYFSTGLTLVLAIILARIGYAQIWPLFGSANQLLSVLALVACAVFLKKTKRKSKMLYIPMLFMMAVTFTALSMTIFGLTGNLFAGTLTLGLGLQLVFAILLLALGIIVAIQGLRALAGKEKVDLQTGQMNSFEEEIDALAD